MLKRKKKANMKRMNIMMRRMMLTRINQLSLMRKPKKYNKKISLLKRILLKQVLINLKQVEEELIVIAMKKRSKLLKDVNQTSDDNIYKFLNEMMYL